MVTLTTYIQPLLLNVCVFAVSLLMPLAAKKNLKKDLQI